MRNRVSLCPSTRPAKWKVMFRLAKSHSKRAFSFLTHTTAPMLDAKSTWIGKGRVQGVYFSFRSVFFQAIFGTAAPNVGMRSSGSRFTNPGARLRREASPFEKFPSEESEPCVSKRPDGRERRSVDRSRQVPWPIPLRCEWNRPSPQNIERTGV